MAEKDGQSNAQEQQAEQTFNQEQYDLLKHCSEHKDMTEWNQWRIDNPDKDILLDKAPLNKFYLAHVWLNKGKFVDASSGKEHEFTGEVNLSKSHLQDAFLEGAYLEGAHLEGAFLQGAWLDGAHLKGANLWAAYLQDAFLEGAYLQDADLWGAHLQGADLWGAHLQGAYLLETYLQNTNLTGANLQCADFSRAIVDSNTLIWKCELDRNTKFEGVSLDAARIYPEHKQLLEYNIRRMNWEQWYSLKNESLPEICNLVIWLVKRLVRCFWAISDYGMSTGRIIVSFFAFAFVFATIYRLWPDFVVFHGNPGVFQSFWHALYFSVVTMTTLGFGDVAANPESWKGLTLLMVQVILGYALLGALITRFAVLFTAGGPAGKFAEKELKDEQKE